MSGLREEICNELFLYNIQSVLQMFIAKLMDQLNIIMSYVVNIYLNIKFYIYVLATNV